MEILTNKTILIISPQEWDFIHISKHYYAIELCKQNNIVYFLNPPSNTNRITIKKIDDFPNLYLIEYKLNCPLWLRFKLRFIFDLYIKTIVSNILSLLPKKPDILWCFDPNLFTDLKIFKAKITIYHPVDLIQYSYQIKPALKADIIFSVSNTFLKKFKELKQPSIFINHGLNDTYKELAEKNLIQESVKTSNKIKVGYWGNLLIASVHHDLFIKIINENQQIEFNFWGPYKPDKFSTDITTLTFIDFLEQSSNVILHGKKHPKAIVEEIAQIEIFIMLYKYNEAIYDCSNSHKILEYLSTGKVIVSNYIELYSSYQDLICMPSNNDNFEIPSIFNKVLHNLNYYNNESFRKRRIEIALKNTYENQLIRIDKKLSELKLNCI
jgi:hypothetical protein